SEITPGLTHLAGLINSFSVAGIAPRDLTLAAVVHGPATKSVLDNEVYRDNFYMDNPNTKLIGELKKAGVRLLVCAQSLFKSGFTAGSVNGDFSLSLSAAVALSTYQMKGYALIAL
ncbi:MAG: DsrE family protein, partial [Endomicrobiales bacterium]